MNAAKISHYMVGNQVWCRNGLVCFDATPCEQCTCQYKNNEKRLAIPKELNRCKSFQITTRSARWETAALVHLPE